ncbi:hypothetical protein ZIOFF_069446 [Zingiber officinale]|uniref:Uncharacterized protein n=1 Tax=Zingiber officinale TaxID=94328 RepID=A0A8J5BH12_ZINOF|nr:hypothetical protein ZIOFF_069446 [Zingiber officinale]
MEAVCASLQLCDLYESDSIFDKFDCCLSGDGLHVTTGSYSNLFRVFGCVPGSNEATTLEASKNPMRYSGHKTKRNSYVLSLCPPENVYLAIYGHRKLQVQNSKSARSSSLTRVVRRGLGPLNYIILPAVYCSMPSYVILNATGAESSSDSNGNSYDFTSKLLHLAWHPTENLIACAAMNSLYMYYA